MKRTKRLFAFIVATLLALPLFCVPALAATGDKHTLTVNNTNAGYTYVLYQMFTGDVSGTGTTESPYVLSNAQWGASVPVPAQIIMYKYCGFITDEEYTSNKNTIDAYFANRSTDISALSADLQNKLKACDAQAVADHFGKSTLGSGLFHDILSYMGTQTGQSITPYTESMQYDANEGYVATDLPEGYYFVYNSGVPEGAVASDYIVTFLGDDTTVEPKAGSVPTTQKKVTDANDSDATVASIVQDSADHDIGDAVTYEVKVTLPGNYTSYTHYKLVFTDVMSESLTYNNDAKIYFGDNDTQGTSIDLVSTANTDTEGSYKGGKTYTYEIENLKESEFASLVTNTTAIRIVYTATLNEEAKVNSTGNPNKFFVEYSNNPTAETTGTTKPDVTTVFTYKLVVNKVKDDDKPLSGAVFRLEKWVTNDAADGGSWVDVTALHSGTGAINPTYVKSASGSVSDSVHTFTGLDDGKYRLVETTTPSGYNTIDPVEFTVEATHDSESDDPRLTALTATCDNATIAFTPRVTLDDASLTANILNKSGATLPSTGGLGTVALCGVGSVVMIGVFVVLVTRRRLRVE